MGSFCYDISELSRFLFLLLNWELSFTQIILHYQMKMNDFGMYLLDVELALTFIISLKNTS